MKKNTGREQGVGGGRGRERGTNSQKERGKFSQRMPNDFFWWLAVYLEQVEITAWSAAEDWFLGQQVFRVTYDTPNNKGQPWKVSFKGCCRMSTLVNNPDRPWEMNMHIDMIKAERSPRVVSLPVIFFTKPGSGLPMTAGFNLRTAMDFDDVVWSAPVPGVSAPADFNGLSNVINVGSAGNVTVNVATTGLVHITAYAAMRNQPSVMVPVDVLVNITDSQFSDPQFDDATMALFAMEHYARPGFEFSTDISGFMKGPVSDPSLYVGFTVGPLPAAAHLSTVRGKGSGPSDPAVMTLQWTPCTDHIGKAVICFDVVNSLGVAATQKCLVINVVADAAPSVQVSLGGVPISPIAAAMPLYIGVSYIFTVTATDSNYLDSVKIMPTDDMGRACVPPSCHPLPPGAAMQPASSRSTWGASMMTMVNVTFAPAHNHGGYMRKHCFTATDSCGMACGASECPGGIQSTTTCVTIAVQRCQYVVRQGQELSEIASVYHSDWLQLWSLNHQFSSPDVGIAPGNIVDIGHMYAVQPFDKPSEVSKRFGMSADAFAILNADTSMGVMDMEQCRTMQECASKRWCILPSSCKGETGSIYQGAYANQAWFANTMGAPKPTAA